MFGNLGQAGKYLGQAARMLIGIPDYDNYVQHMKDNHPDKPVMTYNEFFRERQEARYGGGDGEGGFRCC
ncbi:YbdD/YjiX family protein [Proteus mirabilis]|nr:YbdD/YjiX family protein [Proteus mirabilis]